MNKKKIFLSVLMFISPFFVKGFINGVKNNPTQKTCWKTPRNSDFVFSYDIEPLQLDYLNITSFKANLDLRIYLYKELNYKASDNDFSSVVNQDSCVKYVRTDKSGFSRKYGSLTWRNQNPGAIRTSHFARKMGAIGDAQGFAVFPSEEIGMRALKTLLRSDGYANLTIYEAIHKYAPFCDSNDPIRYQRHLYERTGINTNRKMSDLSEAELDKIAETIKILEGWKPGEQDYFGFVADLLKEFANKNKQNVL